MKSERNHSHSLIVLSSAYAALTVVPYVGLLVILPTATTGVGHDKATLLAFIVSSGSAVAVASGIVAGRISDSQHKTRGSRRRVLLAGAIITIAGLPCFAIAHSMGALLSAWAVVQLGINAVAVVAAALLVDWYVPAERGVASSFAAYGQVAGAFMAAAIAAASGSHVARLAYTSAIVFGALAVPLLIIIEPRTRRTTLPHGLVEQAESIVTRMYGDVWLAWGARATVSLSNTVAVVYLTFYVTDVLRVHSPTSFVSICVAFGALAVLVAAGISARASDRTRRRKRYVMIALVSMAMGEAVLALWKSTTSVFVALVFVGLGYGTYLAVDQALISDVLPDHGRYGRDSGMMNAANTVPQVAAPGLASLVHAASGSYQVVYLVAAGITTIGIVFIRPISAVR